MDTHFSAPSNVSNCLFKVETNQSACCFVSPLVEEAKRAADPFALHPTLAPGGYALLHGIASKIELFSEQSHPRRAWCLDFSFGM
jgi:hypothetical protein